MRLSKDWCHQRALQTSSHFSKQPDIIRIRIINTVSAKNVGYRVPLKSAGSKFLQMNPGINTVRSTPGALRNTKIRIQS